VVNKVFNFLTGEEKKIPNYYMKKQLSMLDKLDGNVDSISNRISNVRTWSYVSNKSNWVENQDYWIERTKNLEDKLSDRLHDELTKTFIDKRASVLAKGLKQDIELKTEILEKEKVLINGQYIGILKGLKLQLDLKVDALDADIKSLKKAARQNVGPEIINRIQQIMDTGLIELRDNFKIYWNNDPIAKLTAGSDYLNPKIDLIVDEMIENDERNKLNEYLHKWILKKINTELNSLIELKNIKEENPQLRALAYRLYENNGVIKRSNISDYLNKINQDDRKKLRKLGVKFGRYHIFLYKLFKPNSVSLRILLWKSYNNKFLNLSPPTFGLNFLVNMKTTNKDFMLLCGFEKFDDIYVRIDILERLFLLIFNSEKDDKKEVKVIPEMLNLLGCSKENFNKLLKKMDYKIYEKEKEVFLKYVPSKKKELKKYDKKNNLNNPFNVLNQLNLK
jgi:ATP-dependent RNA helicase SUPV3L1/SUV3